MSFKRSKTKNLKIYGLKIASRIGCHNCNLKTKNLKLKLKQIYLRV